MKVTEKDWPEVVNSYYDGNDEDAETALHPYLG